jgi:hypothetical protein
MRWVIRIVFGIIITLGVASVLVLLIPLPSFNRSIRFTNQLTTSIEVKCQTLDGRRQQTFQLGPSGQGKFIYFAGDHGGATTVSVLIEVHAPSNGVTLRRQFSLPVDSQPPPMVLSESWFQTEVSEPQDGAPAR